MLVKSVAVLLLLAVLSGLETILVGLIHRRGLAASAPEIGGGGWRQITAGCVVRWLILLPYFAPGGLPRRSGPAGCGGCSGPKAEPGTDGQAARARTGPKQTGPKQTGPEPTGPEPTGPEPTGTALGAI
jgi:hypothetical protein